jgi:hypothetical protein
MATTDARTGFRLPWSSDQRHNNEEPSGDSETPQGTTGAEGSAAAELVEGSEPSPVLETTTMNEGTAEIAADGGAPGAPTERAGSRDRRQSAARAPSKFMADLTKAMQAAAESGREEAMSRLQADAKTAIEQIHTRTATEAADLRRQADDDVAAIREWSKAEISRIRDETDEKIAGRKRRLEGEIEEHGALIERQIQRVQGQVSGYEADMAAFFARLLSEEDPSRFASLAENLPEPPALELAESSWTAISQASTRNATAAAETSPAVATAEREASPPAPSDPEAAMAAIEAAAAEAAWHDARNGSNAAPAEYGSGQFAAETPSPSVAERLRVDEAGPSPTAQDPRLAALAMSPDFAAAEAEAAAAAGRADATEEITTIGDDALAARLAGLVGPESDDAAPAPAVPNATQVVVTGLVSVASIASFKRHLGRLPGVQSVGVSSGPDGEFVFAVRHSPEVVLRDAIPSLPAFQARVTGSSEGSIQVTARDPESEA